MNRMEDELDRLTERAAAMLALSRRLIDENARLKAQLARVQSANVELERRMGEARSRVELALSRLPVTAGQED